MSLPVPLGSPIQESPRKRKRNRKKKKSNGSKHISDALPSQEEDESNDESAELKKKQNKKLKFDNYESSASAASPARDTRAISKPPYEIRKGSMARNVKFENPDDLSANDDEDDYEDEVDLKSFYKPKHVLEEKAAALLKVRENLPVYKVKEELVNNLLSHQVSILIGETGSGKSTQIPQFLMDSSKKGGIAVTQPRRVAAINLATRVSEEFGCVLGHEVGYTVRFQNVSQKSTKLKYLTDGMLLREMMLSSELKQYSTIIIDEAHERTILTDLILGFLKQLLVRRPNDLRLVVMSATLDAEKFSHFFNDAPIYYVEGKMYPVERLYLPKSTDDIVDTMIKTLIQLNHSEQEGDILAFLPGQEEIDKAVTTLNKLAPDLPKEAPYIVALPLYAALPTSQQTKIFQSLKKRQRKIVLSTNIAETSVTIPGIKYVIDSGLRKVKAWKHELGLSTLLVAPISQASATQRAGRAGRETSGKCFRLYMESDYQKLPLQNDPEIIRSDIVSPVLMLKKMNVENLFDWPWLEHPGEKSLKAALFQLLSLGALDSKDGSITDLGVKMSVLPLPPQLSACLITAKDLGVLGPAIDIVACLSVENLLLTPANDRRDEVNEKRRNFSLLGTRHGDLIVLKELFDHFKELSGTSEQRSWCKELDISYKGFKNVFKVRSQLKEYMRNLYRSEKHVVDDDDNNNDEFSRKSFDVTSIMKSFLKGFINNTAIGMPDRSYRTVLGGNLISIHPSSILFGSRSDAVMYIEYVFTAKGYGRNCSRIELSWLQEMAPHLLGTRISAK